MRHICSHLRMASARGEQGEHGRFRVHRTGGIRKSQEQVKERAYWQIMEVLPWDAQHIYYPQYSTHYRLGQYCKGKQG